MAAKLHMIFQNSYSGRNMVEFQLNILSFSCIFIGEKHVTDVSLRLSSCTRQTYLIDFRSVCCQTLYVHHTLFILHYSNVIMGAMASQITSVTIVYSTVCSSADLRKRHSSESLAFVLGIYAVTGEFPHKRPVTRKMFLFDDIIMQRHRYNATFIRGIVQTPATSSKWCTMVATIRWI